MKLLYFQFICVYSYLWYTSTSLCAVVETSIEKQGFKYGTILIPVLLLSTIRRICIIAKYSLVVLSAKKNKLCVQQTLLPPYPV